MSGVLTGKEYEVHFYEVDYKKKLLMTRIMDYFNDVAIYQSEELGIGFDYMTENNIAWILYKWDINIIRYPKYGEKVTARTIPNAFKKFYGCRRFDILDSKGDTLAWANSIWLLVDTKNKKPIKIPKELREVYGLTEEDNHILKIGNIDKIQQVHNSVEFKVRYSDIDTNGHVNNEKYAAWIIESVPVETVLNYTLVNIKITYKKESVYGEKIQVLTDKIEKEDLLVFNHKIMKSDGEELTLGQTIWKKN
ncbi:thioesterase [Clostridium sp. MB40-C1]|uniref:acyl-[acyl-carrier-protein] thioesterase n=1 Tax=Clostridium sp. MB40-C1 TaxID=3070996 RepID=UPI0027E1B961|nr:acyl-ACP thioesterase domain-containing protein [Clostridium sp. MB40-C1]WMJ80117.1 thioesterase [Clostridium sp. MB40-C1]